MGTADFSHAGNGWTGETYKDVVKMTFAKGAALEDRSGLFNSSLDGNVRRKPKGKKKPKHRRER